METCFKDSGYLSKAADGTVRYSASDSPLSQVKKMFISDERTFRHKLEYTLNYKSEEYEEREYPSATWVCTKVSGIYQDSAHIDGFRRIQAYAMGSNAAGARLTVEPPVVTRVTSANDFSFERTFMVCVFLSTDNEVKHPNPSNPDVFIKRLPAMTVFVKCFTGVSTEERWTLETRRLAELLTSQEDVRTDCYLTAIYHSPFQLSSNQNEVWLLKYEHKCSSELKAVGEENMILVGNRHYETSPIVSTLIGFALMYVSILATLGKTALQMLGFVVDNKDTITKQSKKVVSSVSFRTLSRTILGTANVGWTVGKSLLSGLTTEYNKTARRLEEKE